MTMGEPVVRRHWFRSLRVQLSALLVLLISVGLLVAGFIATTSLQGYLLGRVDEQLERSADPFARGFGPFGPGGQGQQDGTGPGASNPGASNPGASNPGSSNPGSGPSEESGRPSPPTRFYIEVRDADGVAEVLSTAQAGTGQEPDVPAWSMDEADARADRPFTVGSVDGTGEWRVILRPLDADAGYVLVASDLADVRSTVGRLVWLQLVVGALVVLAAGGLGYVLVRQRLRPLGGVVEAADDIAAGDLARRVPAGRGSAEVDELAEAFNAMADEIEEAFAAQAASETEARAREAQMRQFVADAGHELRTPLTTVRGFAELLASGGTDTDAGALQRIEAEAARMGVLIEDLLLLARMDSQRPLDAVPVDLLETTLTSVQRIRALHPGHDVQTHVHLDAGEPVVTGDAMRLQQVVDNLLNNAVLHTPEGTHVDVTVRTAVDATNAQIASITVADDGPGIPADAAARIFERFYRVDSARSRHTGGTGLGLSIVAAIVAAHGGTVALDAMSASGTTMVVTLPLAA